MSVPAATIAYSMYMYFSVGVGRFIHTYMGIFEVNLTIHAHVDVHVHVVIILIMMTNLQFLELIPESISFTCDLRKLEITRNVSITISNMYKYISTLYMKTL